MKKAQWAAMADDLDELIEDMNMMEETVGGFFDSIEQGTWMSEEVLEAQAHMNKAISAMASVKDHARDEGHGV